MNHWFRFLAPFLCLLILPGMSRLSAQESEPWKEKAREDIQLLTSGEFAGRGYVKEGHVRTALFISERFEDLGLRPIVLSSGSGATWFQPFTFSINLIMDGQLTLNKQAVDLGEEFIVNKYSGSGEISGKVVDLGHGLDEDQFEQAAGRIVVFRDGWPEDLSAESRDELAGLAGMMDRIMAIAAHEPLGFIVLQSKLTHGFVREQAPFPIVEMLASAWPEKKVKKASLTVESKLTTVRSQNVIGAIPGTCEPDSFVVVCAHYDHLGAVGDAVFAGANDNASGIAMMLSMAEYFSKPAHQPEKSLLFIAFGAEEVGLVGSHHYVNQQPVVPLDKMSFLLNLDLMGNGVDGIMAVGGKTFPGIHQQLVDLNEDMAAVPKVRARTNAPNSDHYWFLEEGVKGFFIYTMGGPTHYHDVFDTAENLELSKYDEVRNLLIRFLEETRLPCGD